MWSLIWRQYTKRDRALKKMRSWEVRSYIKHSKMRATRSVWECGWSAYNQQRTARAPQAKFHPLRARSQQWVRGLFAQSVWAAVRDRIINRFLEKPLEKKKRPKFLGLSRNFHLNLVEKEIQTLCNFATDILANSLTDSMTTNSSGSFCSVMLISVYNLWRRSYNRRATEEQ